MMPQEIVGLLRYATEYGMRVQTRLLFQHFSIHVIDGPVSDVF
jgi:hypothetical protein